MVNHCANPQCCKPLHYLREGRVYVFDVTKSLAAGDRMPRRMEHFWLCGACSEIYLLEQVEDRTVRIVSRPKNPIAPTVLPFKTPQTIAS
jgi:hypothetical protein